MLPDVQPELTEEQIDQLEQAKKVIPKLREQIRKAKMAGIDMTAQEADLVKLEADLDKLYRVYGRRIINTQ